MDPMQYIKWILVALTPNKCQSSSENCFGFFFGGFGCGFVLESFWLGSDCAGVPDMLLKSVNLEEIQEL